MTEQEFKGLSSEDLLNYCEQIAIQFFDKCVVTERHAAMLAKDLFTYFENYCESIDKYFVNLAVNTDWLKEQAKQHIESRDNYCVDLGWFVYQEFVKEGFHDIILGIKIFQLADNMRDPNEPTFITVDYDKETGLVDIN